MCRGKPGHEVLLTLAELMVQKKQRDSSFFFMAWELELRLPESAGSPWYDEMGFKGVYLEERT